jgi:uncharacterized protein
VHLDPWVIVAGLGVGFVVGLTGMGGGALMTPVLVIVFGIQPLAAVSSDLVAAVVMKPVGGGVHLRRRTVRTDLVRWLALGSVPSAFAGVILLRVIGATTVQNRLQVLLGVVLLIAAAALVARITLQPRRVVTGTAERPAARPLVTVLVGVVGGLVVGMTSVGSGSLMIVALMMLYPAMSSAELVGTDLVQAVPLVCSAALGHVLFGDLHLGLTAALLVGSVPGVYAGARVSSRAPDSIVKPTLVVVLVLSALKLLDTPNPLILVAAFVALGIAIWIVIRNVVRRTAMARSSVSEKQADRARLRATGDVSRSGDQG